MVLLSKVGIWGTYPAEEIGLNVRLFLSFPMLTARFMTVTISQKTINYQLNRNFIKVNPLYLPTNVMKLP